MLCPCVNTMSKTKFSDEERLCFYNAILHLDSEKQFVTVDKDNDTLTYNRKNLKSGEKISGRPSDEEMTRCLILLNLIKNYGYKPESIEIENTFAIGGRREEGARAVETDIVIKNKQGVIEIVCEVKRIHEYKGVDDSSIKKQLFDPHENIVKYKSAKYLFYVSLDVPLNKEQFPLNCIGIDTGVSKTYEAWSKQGRTPHLVDIVRPDEKPVIQDIFIKLSGDERNLQKQFKDLNDKFGIDVLRRIWRTLWDYIWGGKGIDFKEFSPQLISKCVEFLSPISFQKNRYKNVDVLGEFYEMVIREAFKQTKGLFLTQPTINNLPIPECLLNGEADIEPYFAEYENESRKIVESMALQEKQLAQLKTNVSALIKEKIVEFYE